MECVIQMVTRERSNTLSECTVRHLRSIVHIIVIGICILHIWICGIHFFIPDNRIRKFLQPRTRTKKKNCLRATTNLPFILGVRHWISTYRRKMKFFFSYRWVKIWNYIFCQNWMISWRIKDYIQCLRTLCHSNKYWLWWTLTLMVQN